MALKFVNCSGIKSFCTELKANCTFGLASRKLSILNIEVSSNISLAIPTSVEIIGVLVIAASTIDCGPPSVLDETIYMCK